MYVNTWWREAEDLDAFQKSVAELKADGKYLVTGRPGSGKTNLLILRATYLTRAGYANINIITYTRLIKEFIASAPLGSDIYASQIHTFLSWGTQVLAEHGIELEFTGNYNNQMEQLLNAMLASESVLSHYDGILIDEMQDYDYTLIEFFARLTPRLFLAGDEKQRLYAPTGAIERAKPMVDKWIELPYHYRNGKRICAVAEYLSSEDGFLEASRYNEDALPSSVSLRRYSDVAAQVTAIIDNLKNQVLAYPNEMLGIIVPYREQRDEIVEILRDSDLEPLCQFQTRDEGYTAFDENRPIVICSAHGSKGLEFRAVHLAGLEGFSDIPPAKRRNLAYTAVTRAKTTLIGYFSGSIEAWLRAAFNRGAEWRQDLSAEDLF